MTEVIDRFDAENRWLSNFWPAEVWLDKVAYPSVEHAYQAAKTLDCGQRAIVQALPRPGQVKRWGRGLVLRPDWALIKVAVMADLVRQKFERNAELRHRLLRTGDAVLVEGNDWGDEFWGKVPDADGRGLNMLGSILMIVRSELVSSGRGSSRSRP